MVADTLHRVLHDAMDNDHPHGMGSPLVSKRESGRFHPRDDEVSFENNENAENGMPEKQGPMSKKPKNARTSFSRYQQSQFTASSPSRTSSGGGSGDIESKEKQTLRTPQSARSQQRKDIMSSSASKLLQRMVDRSGATESGAKKYFTPLRVKPKIKKEDVEATDSGYASVKKLSQWLADDPTSTKKLRHVRRGRNVIAKSRQFEKDLEGVVIEEANISKGAVTGRKDWLKNAFKDGDADANPFGLRSVPGAKRYAQSEIGVPTFSARASGRDDDEARSEIVLDDTSSTLSVSDKKDWLKNAFAKKASAASAVIPAPMKAHSDVLDLRGANREDAKMRAKSRFRERSARNLMLAAQKRERHAADAAASTVTTPVKRGLLPPPSGRRYAPSPRAMPASLAGASSPHAHTEHVSGMPRRSRPRHHEAETRTGPPSSSSAQPAAPFRKDYVVDEDKSSVDFRAARELLVKRSQKNGNDVSVCKKAAASTNAGNTSEDERHDTEATA